MDTTTKPTSGDTCLSLDRVYVGRRLPAPRGFRGECHVTVLDGLEERRLARHPAGPLDDNAWEWGYAGSGPSCLARDLLWDQLDTEPPPQLCFDFKVDVVMHLPHDGWQLTSAVIARWLGQHLRGGEVRA